MQRRLLLGGVVMLVLLAMAGLGLFALHRNQAEARDAMARLEALHGALDLGRGAETAFRLQVQEWKNILLRSHEPEARPGLRRAYDAAAAESAALLGRLEAAAPALR
ncbi:Tat pathway signal sequence domain protein, partial [Pseudoroseomonas cervicalis ATCC 49957]